jgi:hypothetical protein
MGGICDCGDPDSWEESGFCSDHQGYEGRIQEMLLKVPNNYKIQTKEVFSHVATSIKV